MIDYKSLFIRDKLMSLGEFIIQCIINKI